MNAAIPLLLALMLSPAWAGEAWQPVYEDEAISVALDVSSLSRHKQLATFRERHVHRKPKVHASSLRRIVESQLRRQADCGKHRLAVLSRAAFSEADALVNYEAVKPESVVWTEPRGEAETRIYERVCGGKS